MRIFPRSFAGAALPALLVTGPALAYNSPLSAPYGTSQLGGPPLGSTYPGGSYQAPSLWYYGPSYSPYYYNSVPPRPYSSSGATDYYQPSSRHDPFYGRSHHGHWRPWPGTGLPAYRY